MAADTDFDLVLWGATGFVGRRAAHHLASRSGCRGNLRWAIAGRNRAKLDTVRSELGATAKEIPIIVAESHDIASLEELTSRTKVVCSTVGPFAKLGSGLVGACARSGTHYCDLSGEIHWMRQLIDAHQTMAQKTGARIVHACGMDSIPSDIGVFFLQREAKARYGGPCSHVKMRVTAMRGGFSGGTAASLVHGMETGPRDRAIMRDMSEPYSLNPHGQRQGPDGPDKFLSAEVVFDEDLQAWTKPFFMAPVNSKIVRRTNALLGFPYGEHFRYEEASLVGPGAGRLDEGDNRSSPVLRVFTRHGHASYPVGCLKRYLLPGSGEGPSREICESGSWELILIGKLDNGNVLRARINGTGDPATESTSRMLVESALCLALESGKITVNGGFWTPASAMGALLLSRLTSNAGLSFELG